MLASQAVTDGQLGKSIDPPACRSVQHQAVSRLTLHKSQERSDADLRAGAVLSLPIPHRSSSLSRWPVRGGERKPATPYPRSLERSS